MSFGSVVSRPALCPCGSGDPFAECCAPLLDGAPAPSPERLMRSRYTAFARADAAHLVRTWHPRTRPESVDLDPGLVWTRLDILDTAEAGDEGIVEFRAHWRTGAGRGVLHERSRFARRGGRWFYLDGDAPAE